MSKKIQQLVCYINHLNQPPCMLGEAQTLQIKKCGLNFSEKLKIGFKDLQTLDIGHRNQKKDTRFEGKNLRNIVVDWFFKLFASNGPKSLMQISTIQKKSLTYSGNYNCG